MVGLGFWREWEVWQRNLYVLWAIEFAAFAGLSLILPFLPLYIRHLGVTAPADVTRWSGLVLSAPFMLSFVATPIWGALGDRYGQKLMVVRALLAGAACYVGMGLATSVGALFAWGLLLGAVSGFLSAGFALLSVTVPAGRRGYALGLLLGVVPAATLVGPLLGGMVADAIGYRPVFILVAAICAGAGVTAAVLLADVREPDVRRGGPPRVRDNLRIGWARRDLRRALLAIATSQAITTTLSPIFVLYVEQLGVPPRLLSTGTGVLFAATGVTALLAAPWWGRRADRLGFRGSFSVAVFGAAITLALQGVVTAALQLLALRLLYGCFTSGIVPPLLRYVTNAAPPEHRGGLMGLCASAAMVGNLLGPLAGGLIGGHLGLRPVFFLSAALMLVTNWYASRLAALRP